MKKGFILLLVVAAFLMADDAVRVYNGTYQVFKAKKVKSDTVFSAEYDLSNIFLSGDFGVQYKFSKYGSNIQVKIYFTQGVLSGWYCNPVLLDSIDTNANSYTERQTISNKVAPVDYLKFFIVNFGVAADSVKCDSFFFKVREER